MNETMMTIVGNVVDQPRRRETKNGHVVTNFRIASTSRRYDREQEKFIDDSTLYVTVTCWRGMGKNGDVSPTVLVDGVVAATWSYDRNGAVAVEYGGPATRTRTCGGS